MSMCLFTRIWESTDSVYLILHPYHKLSYFQHAGWTPEWIVSEKKIVQDEFDHSYCFQDDIVSAIGPIETNEPLLIRKCLTI
jgi:hypothetical protein